MFFTNSLYFRKKGIRKMGLEYDYPEREKACVTKPLKVKLDGRSVGEIRKVKDGYQYYPSGQKKGGGVFSKVSEVQNSLLGIQSRKTKGQTPAEDDSSEESIEQAKAGMKKLKGDLVNVHLELGRASVLLKASFDLLQKQKGSEEVLNLLLQNVNYDDIDCDGHSLAEDIKDYLEQ